MGNEWSEANLDVDLKHPRPQLQLYFHPKHLPGEDIRYISVQKQWKIPNDSTEDLKIVFSFLVSLVEKQTSARI